MNSRRFNDRRLALVAVRLFLLISIYITESFVTTMVILYPLGERKKVLSNDMLTTPTKTLIEPARYWRQKFAQQEAPVSSRTV